MTNKHRTTVFDKGIFKGYNDLPDHLLQNINDTCSNILVAALVDKEGNKRDPNIALGGMQKALALLVAKFYREDQIPTVMKDLCIALIESVKSFSEQD